MNRWMRVGWYEAFALLAGLTIFTLAWANRLTFPFPWNDEARFYLPALWLVNHGTFTPSTVNAPQGIFWVPDGFTVFLGLVLRLFGQSIQVARAACECLIAAGVVLFALEFRRLSGSKTAGALATLLVLTPPVVFSANMVRMEALIFLLIAVALLLHRKGYVLGVSALLFGSLLFHPALGLAAIAYAALSYALRRREGGSRRFHALEWLLLAAVLVCWLLEGWHIAHHLDLFRAHMTYQIGQKRMRGSLIARLIKPQGIILFLCCAATTAIIIRQRVWERLEAHRGFLGTAAIVLGVQTYAVLASELNYDIYSLSLAPAVVFCFIANALRTVSVEPNMVPLVADDQHFDHCPH